MVYPVIIGGTEVGSLKVSSEGLFTVFEAEAAAEGLVRLAVFGGGSAAYLGVMQPWNGGLYLRRRLSRSELRKFPRVIEYAAPPDEPCAAPDGRDGSAAAVSEERDTEKVQAVSAADIDDAGGDKATVAENANCENTAEPVTAASDILWYRRPDGTLVHHDGDKSIIAIPAELRRRAPGAVLRIINGRSYMLFRY